MLTAYIYFLLNEVGFAMQLLSILNAVLLVFFLFGRDKIGFQVGAVAQVTTYICQILSSSLMQGASSKDCRT